MSQDSSFIVVVGPDGAGKSTILKALRGMGFKTAAWRDMYFMIFGAAFYSLLSGLVNPVLHYSDFIKQLNPALRSCLHILIWHIFYKQMIQGQGPVVVDSYIYKTVAKEKLFGVCPEWFYAAMGELPSPDLVIVIEGSFKDDNQRTSFEQVCPKAVFDQIVQSVKTLDSDTPVVVLKNHKGRLRETLVQVLHHMEVPYNGSKQGAPERVYPGRDWPRNRSKIASTLAWMRR